MTKGIKPVPSIDLFIPSARLIKDNLLVFFVLSVVPLLLSSITDPMPVLSSEATTSELLRAFGSTITPYMVIGGILSLVFYPILIYAQWQAAKGKQLSLVKVFRESFTTYWKVLGLLLLMGIILMLGFAAFVIPGLIFLRMFVFAPFYLLEDKLSIVDALKKSAQESREYRWSIYGIVGITVLFALTSSFGVIGQIISTILSVLYSLAFALRFHELRGKIQLRER